MKKVQKFLGASSTSQTNLTKQDEGAGQVPLGSDRMDLWAEAIKHTLLGMKSELNLMAPPTESDKVKDKLLVQLKAN